VKIGKRNHIGVEGDTMIEITANVIRLALLEGQLSSGNVWLKF
jgi:hypothetical protein